MGEQGGRGSGVAVSSQGGDGIDGVGFEPREAMKCTCNIHGAT